MVNKVYKSSEKNDKFIFESLLPYCISKLKDPLTNNKDELLKSIAAMRIFPFYDGNDIRLGSLTEEGSAWYYADKKSDSRNLNKNSSYRILAEEVIGKDADDVKREFSDYISLFSNDTVMRNIVTHMSEESDYTCDWWKYAKDLFELWNKSDTLSYFSSATKNIENNVMLFSEDYCSSEISGKLIEYGIYSSVGSDDANQYFFNAAIGTDRQKKDFLKMLGVPCSFVREGEPDIYIKGFYSELSELEYPVYKSEEHYGKCELSEKLARDVLLKKHPEISSYLSNYTDGLVIRNVFGDFIPLNWDLFYHGQENSDFESGQSEYDNTFELLHIDAGLYDTAYLGNFETIHKFEDIDDDFESFYFAFEFNETDFYKWLWLYSQHESLADIILSYYSGDAENRETVPYEDRTFVISVLRAYTSDNDYVFDIDFDENEVFSMFSDINAISNQYNSVYPVVCGDFELLDSEKIKEDIRSHLINSIHADLSRIDEILNDEIWEHVYKSSVKTFGYETRYIHAVKYDIEYERVLVLPDVQDENYFIQVFADFISEKFEVFVNSLVDWNEKYTRLVRDLKKYFFSTKPSVPIENLSNKDIEMSSYIDCFEEEMKIWNEVMKSRRMIKNSKSLALTDFIGRKDYLTSQYHGYCQICHERTPSGVINNHYFTYRICQPKRGDVDELADLAANLFAVCPSCHGALRYGYMGFNMELIFKKSSDYVKEFLDNKEFLEDADDAPSVIASVMEDYIKKPLKMKNTHKANNAIVFKVTVNGQNQEMFFSWDHFIRLAMILNEDMIYDD